ASRTCRRQWASRACATPRAAISTSRAMLARCARSSPRPLASTRWTRSTPTSPISSASAGSARKPWPWASAGRSRSTPRRSRSSTRLSRRPRPSWTRRESSWRPSRSTAGAVSTRSASRARWWTRLISRARSRSSPGRADVRAMLMRRPAPVADRPLRMEDVADPTPGPGEVLVEVRACGMCRTDLHVVEGELPMLRIPLVPGHQVVGRVAGRGADATRFREGDRIGIAWLRRACGRCLYCATDRENLCERAEFTGWHADGGYAEYAVVDEDYAYAIPSVFDDVQAAPLLC